MQPKSPLKFSAVTITGSRVTLVPISPKYADSIFNEFTDEITRYMIPATPSSIEQVNAFIQSSIDSMNENSELILAILQRDSNEFLGVCGLHGKLNPDEPVLGIWLKKSAHGHKYGQEAIQVLVEWTRQNIIYKYLEYPCDQDNIASRKIAEKLNGVLFRTGQTKSMSGQRLNEVAYKID